MMFVMSDPVSHGVRVARNVMCYIRSVVLLFVEKDDIPSLLGVEMGVRGQGVSRDGWRRRGSRRRNGCCSNTGLLYSCNITCAAQLVSLSFLHSEPVLALSTLLLQTISYSTPFHKTTAQQVTSCERVTCVHHY